VMKELDSGDQLRGVRSGVSGLPSRLPVLHAPASGPGRLRWHLQLHRAPHHQVACARGAGGYLRGLPPAVHHPWHLHLLLLDLPPQFDILGRGGEDLLGDRVRSAADYDGCADGVPAYGVQNGDAPIFSQPQPG